MTGSDDQRFDDVLREAASRDYHAPPSTVPRDEMWERIAAARAVRRVPEDVVPPPPPDVIVLPRRRRWRSSAWAARALAAALLLAAGIGVGRWSMTTRAGTTAGATTGVTHVAATTPPALPPSTTTSESPPRAAVTAPSPATASVEVAVATPGTSTRGDRAPSSARGATRHDREATGAESREPRAERSQPPIAFRLAAVEHLALTETLLTTVSADARAGRAADSSVALWARDLLGTTRMLLDSPAARDPKMARLLQDLELVLAEVAQLKPARGAEELQSIDRAVRQRGVLTRLRATVPAAPLSAGT